MQSPILRTRLTAAQLTLSKQNVSRRTLSTQRATQVPPVAGQRPIIVNTGRPVVGAPQPHPVPNPPRAAPGGRGPNVPVIIGIVAVGGGLIWYFNKPAEAKREIRQLENKAETAFDATKDKTEAALEKTKYKVESVLDSAKDKLPADRSTQSQAKADEVKSKASGWFSSAESDAEKAKREATAAYQDTKSVVGKKVEEVKQEGQSWLSWGGDKAAEAKSTAKDQVADAKYSAKQNGEGIKAEVNISQRSFPSPTLLQCSDPFSPLCSVQQSKSWFSWGSAKADDAEKATKSAARDAEYKIQSAADSANRTAQEAANATKRGYYEAKDSAERELDATRRSTRDVAQYAEDGARDTANAVKRGAEDAGRVAQEKAEEAKQAASSWFSWGSKKADEAADVAATKANETKDAAVGAGHGVKDNVKDGLLWAENKVESGAQRAQHETKKL
ncbi:BQ5605_C002g01413 [Microbotryum silenes-dioicae]|uniref:BQ5605_C002g01413 protein n=1 Tax=Microbotryum silenes-dioicae TaxID=796604 RepID=A0A2X0LYQ9_9BASI|nr:BQ5605_C002g01413 [Microbotryum silenes-dioicae]